MPGFDVNRVGNVCNNRVSVTVSVRLNLNVEARLVRARVNRRSVFRTLKDFLSLLTARGDHPRASKDLSKPVAVSPFDSHLIRHQTHPHGFL